MKTEKWFEQKLKDAKKSKDFWIESIILALEERMEKIYALEYKGK